LLSLETFSSAFSHAVVQQLAVSVAEENVTAQTIIIHGNSASDLLDKAMSILCRVVHL